MGGAAAGSLVAGAEGAVVGAGVGAAGQEALLTIAQEIETRLTARGAARVGVVLRIARDEISARLMNGEELRTDGFLTVDPRSRRAPSFELAEAVALAAQNAYEERKLPYLATCSQQQYSMTS